MDHVHRALDHAFTLRDRAIDRYHALNPTGKAMLWVWVALHFVFAAVFYFVGWENIFACQSSRESPLHSLERSPFPLTETGLAGLADNIRELPYGWAILSGVIVVRLAFPGLLLSLLPLTCPSLPSFLPLSLPDPAGPPPLSHSPCTHRLELPCPKKVTSLPPLIGYGTAQTLVGFAYGVHPGWLISSFSCLVGGVFSFLLVRRLVGVFAPYIHKDKTFQALSQAVRVKGLPLIILLRLCPFPYPYSNAFFASVETVTLLQFFLATLTITPKLLLHVFVGHRTYLFASPEHRSKMDPLSKWLKCVSSPSWPLPLGSHPDEESLTLRLLRGNSGAFMVVGTLLGAATSWYLYKLTMRYVEEASGASEHDLEAGLLDDVDELLLSSRSRESETEEEELAPGSAGEEEPVRRTATLVDTASGDLEGEQRDGGRRATNELWEETFSDFDDESQQRRVEEEEGAKDGRRDSMAWGLDDPELESFGDENGHGASSIDKRLD
ncbi:SPOSA6832_00370 [Sporobolomyces salmonicolor]|uniref:Golgi apparatus membrane protein TVP38 n=1 Tax=Sporidiobolus salmonicolor TaxID=5005 RepID=A0A0D6EGI8_SPOSA|nr:SPOSA6832_00370 [Sporobolomyces salmonicolor]